jgi:hypothetical protein
MYQTEAQRKTWEQDPAEFKEVINLAAQFNAFKKKFNDEKSKQGKTKQQQSGQKRLSVEEWRKKRYDEAPAWMKHKPKELHYTKQRDGKTYHWCTKHNMWTLHKSLECKLETPTKTQSNRNNKDKDKDGGGDKED